MRVASSRVALIRDLRRSAGMFSAAMRFLSLLGKFCLSIYMARYTSLEDLGLYGLAFGGVMIATAFFGMRLDYSLMRILPSAGRTQASAETNGSVAFYFGNYLVFAPLAGLAAVWALPTVKWYIIGEIYLLFCAESLANLFYNITISIDRARLANMLFFVRSGLWAGPAIGIGLAVPSLRTAEFVLEAWLTGCLISLFLSIYITRTQIDWRWPRWPTGRAQSASLRLALQKNLGIWIGTLAVTAGGYCDRLFVARFLTLSDVGVATFYLSFTTAVVTLVQSATFVPRQAQLVRSFDNHDLAKYREIIRQTLLASMFLSAFFSTMIGFGVHLLAHRLGNPEIVRHLDVFAILLVAAVVRTLAEGVYYPLFVERSNLMIWLGNIAFLIFVLITYLLFVRQFGLLGLAGATFLSSCFLLFVRLIGWRAGKRMNPETE